MRILLITRGRQWEGWRRQKRFMTTRGHQKTKKKMIVWIDDLLYAIECALWIKNTLVLCCYNGLVMVSGGYRLETSEKYMVKLVFLEIPISCKYYYSTTVYIKTIHYFLIRERILTSQSCTMVLLQHFCLVRLPVCS